MKMLVTRPGANRMDPFSAPLWRNRLKTIW